MKELFSELLSQRDLRILTIAGQILDSVFLPQITLSAYVEGLDIDSKELDLDMKFEDFLYEYEDILKNLQNSKDQLELEGFLVPEESFLNQEKGLSNDKHSN